MRVIVLRFAGNKHARIETVYSTSFTVEPAFPINVRATLAQLIRGNHDPIARFAPGSESAFWTSARVGKHPVVIRIQQDQAESSRLKDKYLAPIQIQLWAQKSPSALVAIETAVHQIPDWVGCKDDWTDFLESDSWQYLPPTLQRSYQTHPGIRLGSTHQFFWHAATAITEQRVTGIEAMGGLRSIIKRTAEPFPLTGQKDQPQGMYFFPTPSAVKHIPSWAWHQAGYDQARSTALVQLAERADSLHRLMDFSPVEEFAKAFASIPGVGPWTVAETLQRTHGHPDAVSVGDFHLAHHVGWAFEQRRATDARMLELLSPFRGNRNRVIALIKASRIEAPKHGARYRPLDFRTF